MISVFKWTALVLAYLFFMTGVMPVAISTPSTLLNFFAILFAVFLHVGLITYAVRRFNSDNNYHRLKRQIYWYADYLTAEQLDFLIAQINHVRSKKKGPKT